MALFGILASLFPFFVIAGIVMLVRRSRSGTPGSGDASVSFRRLLEYGFLAVALGLAASGLDSLFSAAVEALVEGTDDVDTPSWAITSLLVGGTALWFLVRNVRRRFAETPDEQGALGWVLYQGIVELATLIGFATAVNDLLDGIIGAGDVEPQNLVHLAVWGAVWVVHIRLGDRIVGGEPVRSTLVPFAVSINALGALVASVGGLIALCFMAVYEGITGYSSWGGTVDGIRDVASVLIVSVALWWWYWLRQAVHDRGSMLHHAYTLFVGVLGGLGALVGVSVMFLAALINWGFAIGEDPAVEYFEFLPVAVTVAVVATLVWRYHRELVPPAEGRPRNDVDRAADHLAAFVGICALLAGVFVVLFVAFHHLTPVPPGAERETTMVVVIGLPLLVVGALVRRRFWQAVQIHADDPEEVGSAVRRAYLYVIFGISGIAALVALLFLVFQVIDGILNTSFDREGIWDLHAPLAIAITAGLAAAYHRRVMRSDQNVLAAVVPEPVAVSPRAAEQWGPGRVIVVAADPAPLAAAVEMATGAEVEVIRRSDAPPVEFDLDAARMEIAESDAATLMVVVGPGGDMLLVPVDRS
tara:strand:+ start:92 stop:1849 length:1758 start_codon:yes stop_codon:yes gene_type:complete